MSRSQTATKSSKTATCAKGTPPQIGIDALANSFLEFLEEQEMFEGTAIPGKVEAVPSDEERETVALSHIQDSTTV